MYDISHTWRLINIAAYIMLLTTPFLLPDNYLYWQVFDNKHWLSLYSNSPFLLWLRWPYNLSSKYGQPLEANRFYSKLSWVAGVNWVNWDIGLYVMHLGHGWGNIIMAHHNHNLSDLYRTEPQVDIQQIYIDLDFRIGWWEYLIWASWWDSLWLRG